MAELIDRSDEELFDECLRLNNEDDDRRWIIIGELSVERATRSIFDRALVLATSDRQNEMCLGIDVLNDFGPKANFPWRDETVAALVNALRHGDEAVIQSAVDALGKFGPAAAVADVVNHARSDNDAIRLSVAMALPSFAQELDSDDGRLVISTLISLMRDEESVIRDWSTFGLGSQTFADGPEVRAALLARLDDTDANTRDEAVVGLARRHDRRVIPALIRALEADEVSRIAIGAADVLGSPDVTPALLRLAQDPNWTEEELADAIRRCDIEAQESLLRRLAKFMHLIEATCVGVSCFSECIAIDSGGPQIAYSDGQRYLTWSFEELLDRAAGSPAIAAQLVVRDIAGEIRG